MIIEGSVWGSWPEATIQALLADWPRLTGAIPGLRDLAIDGTSVTGTMVVPLPFMDLVSRIEGTVEREDDRLVVRVVGHPERLVGTFTCDIVLELAQNPERTEFGMRYRLTLQTSGRLASLGDAMLRSVSGKQAALFEDRLRALLEEAVPHDHF
ncbi:MAG: SRPBCC domain-containing protein [Firmicutes bacterium]|nr:SRPBCC domain-containing protein [Bacillota bacterium]